MHANHTNLLRRRGFTLNINYQAPTWDKIVIARSYCDWWSYQIRLTLFLLSIFLNWFTANKDMIFQLHILSKHDCDRGLIYEYCVKTLTRRTPATGKYWKNCRPKQLKLVLTSLLASHTDFWLTRTHSRWEIVFCWHHNCEGQYCHLSDHCLPKTAYNWTTNRPWRLLVSAIPIMPPCLSVDDRSLTIVCVEGPCNVGFIIYLPIIWRFWIFYFQDARLTEDIAVCAERYSRGLVHFMDWSPGNNIPVM